MFLLF
jgi:hypothetical protein